MLPRSLSNIAKYFARLGEPGVAVWGESLFLSDPQERLAFLDRYVDEFQRQASHGDRYCQPMVGVDVFVNSPLYMGARTAAKDQETGEITTASRVWPSVMPYLVEANIPGKYTEMVATGAIGSAKTTLALWTQVYQLYGLSCYSNPHKIFDLDPASEILVVFQSVNKKTAEDVDYLRFRTMVEQGRYFREKFQFDEGLKSEMRFAKRIIVRPINSSDTGAIGANVIGGILDEMNFMAQVQDSVRSRNTDGTYDQAIENYQAIARRRESRFMVMGELPGMLCLVSSANYKGQFTDTKIAEAQAGNKRIFVYNKTLYDLRPDRFCGDKFEVFIGDESRKPFVLGPDDVIAEKDSHLILEVPTEYEHTFQADILKALRDVAGVSTSAIHPFMPEVDRVVKCFGQVRSIFSRDSCDFKDTKVGVYPKHFLSLSEPRAAHIDLGLTSDSAGLCVGHVAGFVSVQRGPKHQEMLPLIVIDGLLEVRPPRNGEISFEKVREVLYAARELGLPIQWVTLDSYQSVDTKQLLRARGFSTGGLSMDTSTLPYDICKQALYDGRISAPTCPKIVRELTELERTVKGNSAKIDHRPGGSKDLADALTGVVYTLSRRLEVWARHGVQPSQIPEHLRGKATEVKVEETNVGRRTRAR